MSKFRIGTRVRLVHGYVTGMGSAVFNPVPTGAEGVITAFQQVPKGTVCRGGAILTEHSDCQVNFGEAYGVRSSNTERLEPLVPDGHRSGDHSYTELMDRLKAGEVECV